MNKTLLKIGVGGIAGIGLGLFIGKHKIDKLEAERDMLETKNTCLESDCESIKRCNDNLREANKLFANLLLQGKENEET